MTQLLADKSRIAEYIPQRPPFVMVDCLYRAEEKFVRTGFTPPASNIFSRDGVFTEPGLIENMAQSSAAGTGYYHISTGKPVPVGYIGAVKNFRLLSLAKINEELVTDVEVVTEVMNASVIRATISCGDRIIATGEMKIFLAGI